jgi:hypothetical protein
MRLGCVLFTGPDIFKPGCTEVTLVGPKAGFSDNDARVVEGERPMARFLLGVRVQEGRAPFHETVMVVVEIVVVPHHIPPRPWPVVDGVHVGLM